MDLLPDIMARVCLYVGTLRDLSSLACTCKKMHAFVKPEFVLSADGYLRTKYPNLKYWSFTSIQFDFTIPQSVVHMELRAPDSISIGAAQGSMMETFNIRGGMIHDVGTEHMLFLTTIDIQDVCLSSLTLPPAVKYVNLSSNLLESITVPRSVEIFICENNILTEITVLSQHLKVLNVNDNYLSALDIPEQLEEMELYCEKNKWLSVLHIPRGVILVNCTRCSLSTLTLQDGIKTVDASYNLLVGNLNVPDSVLNCNVTHNFLAEIEVRDDRVLKCDHNYYLAQNNAKYVNVARIN